LLTMVLAGMRLPASHEGRALGPSRLDYSAPPFGRFLPLGGRFVASVLGTTFRDEPVLGRGLTELPVAAPGSSAPKATPVTVQPDGSYAGSSVSSSYPKISADGRSIAFLSASPDLDPRCAKTPSGSAPCGIQVYVRDVFDGVTELVSLTANGGIPNAESFGPSISADGRYVVWHSIADNIVPGDLVDSEFGTPEADVFLRDRVLGRTERITVRSNGAELNGGNASISADGRMVAFDADFEHRPNSYTQSFTADTYVKDRETGDVTLASTGNRAQRGNHDSRGPLISPDGGYVVFWSRATNLTDGLNLRAEALGRAGFPWGQVYVYDIAARRLSLECVSTSGVQADEPCWGYNISAGGRYSIFWSTATNLVPTSPQAPQPDQAFNLYLRDRLTGELEIMNVNDVGVPVAERWPREIPYVRGGKRSPQPYLSWDGSVVGFETDVALVPEDSNRLVDAYIRDRAAGRTLRMSEAPPGVEPNGWSQWPCLSANGSTVSFISAADNLAPGDDHEGWDVFVRRWRR
jgi:hypothetical protein